MSDQKNKNGNDYAWKEAIQEAKKMALESGVCVFTSAQKHRGEDRRAIADRHPPVIPEGCKVRWSQIQSHYEKQRDLYVSGTINLDVFLATIDFSRPDVRDTLAGKCGTTYYWHVQRTPEHYPQSDDSVLQKMMMTQHTGRAGGSTKGIEPLLIVDYPPRTFQTVQEAVRKRAQVAYLDMEASLKDVRSHYGNLIKPTSPPTIFDSFSEGDLKDLSNYVISKRGAVPDKIVEGPEFFIDMNSLGCPIAKAEVPLPMVLDEKCPHCTNGVVQLFVSSKPCDRCGGTGKMPIS